MDMSVNCNSVSWSDSYLLGDETIDKEHKQLFNLTEQLFNCQDDETEVLTILKELIKYTKFHFAHEEQFMRSINFKYFDDHKRLHKEIIDKLEKNVKEKDTLSPQEYAKKLALFVRDNIVDHILTEDKRVHHHIKDTELLKSFFQWKETYEIQEEKIDNEHQKLFTIAIKVLDTPKENKKEHIRTILKELNNYMQEHFKHEEEFMLSIGFPEYESHIKAHHDIILQMNEFIKTIPTLSIEKFERMLIEYMDIWLINHILVEDRKIVCFQSSKENT